MDRTHTCYGGGTHGSYLDNGRIVEFPCTAKIQVVISQKSLPTRYRDTTQNRKSYVRISWCPSIKSSSAWQVTRLEILFNSFLQKHLDQGLIRHIALVCHLAQSVQKRFRKAQGNCLGGRFQVGEKYPFGALPVQVFGGIVLTPKILLLVFILEFRNWFAYKFCVPFLF